MYIYIYAYIYIYIYILGLRNTCKDFFGTSLYSNRSHSNNHVIHEPPVETTQFFFFPLSKNDIRSGGQKIMFRTFRFSDSRTFGLSDFRTYGFCRPKCSHQSYLSFEPGLSL